MFVGYTRKYSMAVWTGYTNRLTPIVGDGFTVATSIYRSMMQYLSQDDHPGDWTMPEGLYRSGDYVFKNGARSNWIPQTTQQPVTEVQNSTTENQTSATENNNSNTSRNGSTPNTNQNPGQPQNSRRQQ